MRILFFGDSITQGFWGIEGGWVERIRKHFDTLAVADLDNSKQPYVFNLGISGDTTRSLLKRIESETSVRIWQNEPIMVVIAIGTNDDLFEASEQWVPPEDFKANLKKIISLLQPITNTIMLIGNPACDESKTTPVSWGDFTYTNKELQRSEATIAEAAKEHGLPYVPIFEEFKQKLDAGADLLADGLHPNDAGHQFIADKVLPKLEESL